MRVFRLLSHILNEIAHTPQNDHAFNAARQQLHAELRHKYEAYTRQKLQDGWSCVHRAGLYTIYDAQFNQLAAHETECYAWAIAQWNDVWS